MSFYCQQHPTLASGCQAKSNMWRPPGLPHQRKQVKIHREQSLVNIADGHYILTSTPDHKALKTMVSGELEFSQALHAGRERLKGKGLVPLEGKQVSRKENPLSSDLSNHLAGDRCSTNEPMMQTLTRTV